VAAAAAILQNVIVKLKNGLSTKNTKGTKSFIKLSRSGFSCFSWTLFSEHASSKPDEKGTPYIFFSTNKLGFLTSLLYSPPIEKSVHEKHERHEKFYQVVLFVFFVPFVDTLFRARIIKGTSEFLVAIIMAS
jgi:hypothetical protein